MKHLLFCLIKYMDRKKISKKYKWNLEDIYKNNTEYENAIKGLKKLSKDLLKYKSKIMNNSSNLLNTLLLDEKIGIISERLYVYINMKLHEDTRVGKYQELSGNLSIMLTNINEELSFVVPEILEKDYKLVKEYIKENKELKRFEFLLETIFNEKEHILSKDIEKLLSRGGNLFEMPDNIFSMLDDADLVSFGKIKDEDGNEIELTKGNYHNFMTSKNREVRKEAFNLLYSKYKELNNTLASTLNSNLLVSNFLTNTRKYKAPINLYLDSNKINENIYYNLIEKVNNNINKMYKYNSLRKQELKIKELHLYDMSVKLSDIKDKKYTYEAAKSIILEALSVFGNEYIDILKNAFGTNWIDVYENDGKRSGAYSWGCYDVHPFVLLNYQGKYNDVSTIAHEMGHAIHKYYTNSNQDYNYSDNAIFVAEIASTVNEILLNLYMLENSKDNNEKKMIINELLDDIKSTVYRQTMFAEFELDIHNRSYKGETLSADKLNNIYYKLAKKYHGKDMICDEYIKYEWSRIPHFYSPFYVYQYATGFSIAFEIANKIYNNDKVMLNKYIEFLKSGSNDYPTNLVEKMGINISKSIDNTLNYFETLIDKYNNIDKE